jgi:hypothetical protein
VIVIGLVLFVTALKETVTSVPQHASLTVGASNVHAVSQATVLLVAQMRTGGVVSNTVTLWRHVTIFVEQSVACQVRVITVGQGLLLVTVLRTEIVKLVPQQEVAFGGSNRQVELHSTVLLGAQVSDSGALTMKVPP